MKLFAAILCIGLPTFYAFGYVETVESVAVSEGMSEWVHSFEERSTEEIRNREISLSTEGYTECFETAEITGAFICASYLQVNMNKALARASFFVEGLGNHPAGTVVDQDNPEVQRYLRLIGGHDLRSEDLIKFWQEVERQCEIKQTKCANDFERDLFENFILPTAKKYENFVLITYATVSSMLWNAVVTHEIMHAQYFLDQEFREIADQFWTEKVSDADKTQVRNTLSQHYDASNEFLMINEFQAYILMADAEFNLLGAFVEKYRGPLMEAMKQAGIQPVQVR